LSEQKYNDKNNQATLDFIQMKKKKKRKKEVQPVRSKQVETNKEP